MESTARRLNDASPEEWNQASQSLKNSSPLKSQVGGDHYKLMAIQPVEFTLANRLNFCQGNVIKYTVREKGDTAKKIEDRRKAIHYLELEIAMIERGVL